MKKRLLQLPVLFCPKARIASRIFAGPGAANTSPRTAPVAIFSPNQPVAQTINVLTFWEHGYFEAIAIRGSFVSK